MKHALMIAFVPYLVPGVARIAVPGIELSNPEEPVRFFMQYANSY